MSPDPHELDLRITHRGSDTTRTVTGPVVAADGRFTWTGNARGRGAVVVRVGYNGTWSAPQRARR